MPVRYHLVDCFKDLKSGRTNEDQKYLQKMIDDLLTLPRKNK